MHRGKGGPGPRAQFPSQDPSKFDINIINSEVLTKAIGLTKFLLPGLDPDHCFIDFHKLQKSLRPRSAKERGNVAFSLPLRRAVSSTPWNVHAPRALRQ